MDGNVLTVLEILNYLINYKLIQVVLYVNWKYSMGDILVRVYQ